MLLMLALSSAMSLGTLASCADQSNSTTDMDTETMTKALGEEGMALAMDTVDRMIKAGKDDSKEPTEEADAGNESKPSESDGDIVVDDKEELAANDSDATSEEIAEEIS